MGLSVGSRWCSVSPFVCFYASSLLLYVVVYEKVSAVYVYVHVCAKVRVCTECTGLSSSISLHINVLYRASQ